MAKIETLIESINDSIKSAVSYTINAYNLTKIIDKTSDKYPARWNENDNGWNRISLNDNFDLLFYHRLNGIETSNEEAFDFGSFERENTRVFNLSLYVYFKKPFDEEQLEEILDSIPVNITDTEGTDYAFVTVSITNIETDQDEIVEEEFTGVTLDKHKSKFNIYKVNYSIETIIC